jgi:hypothetical protein
MKKLIIVTDYPSTFSFHTKEKLPRFKFDCPVRTRIIQEELVKQKIETPYHEPNHYMVEEITRFEGGEIWGLGT